MPLNSYAEAIPLVSILPMDPLRYPLATCALGLHDLVLDVSDTANQPFAVLFYVRHCSDGEPAISQKQDSWSLHRHYVHALSNDFALCAMLYADSTTFVKWPELEYEITGRARVPGEKVVWPIFQST